MNGRSLVLVEDDAGDTFLWTEMLLEVALGVGWLDRATAPGSQTTPGP